MLTVLVIGAVFYELSQVRSDVTAARESLVNTFTQPEALRTPEGRALIHAKVDDALETLSAARRRAAESKPISLLRLVPSGATQRTGIIELIDDAALGATAVRDLLGDVWGHGPICAGRVRPDGLPRAV